MLFSIIDKIPLGCRSVWIRLINRRRTPNKILSGLSAVEKYSDKVPTSNACFNWGHWRPSDHKKRELFNIVKDVPQILTLSILECRRGQKSSIAT
jgi:hypothetical protein